MSLNDFLSSFGKRVYLPNGILVQNAQAVEYCKDLNATAGVAKLNGSIMYLDSSMNYFSNSLIPSEIYSYSPIGGNKKLREIWLNHIINVNEISNKDNITLPIVTAGITNSLSLTFSLFAEKDTDVVLPEYYWENYNLIIDIQTQAKKHTFTMFDGNNFNISSFKNCINSIKSKKIVILFNFPNNPTGFTLQEKEAKKITDFLKEKAREGIKFTVIIDDAYFSLFYEDYVFKKSLFSMLYNLDSNILAVKCDGATKEELAWGFRIGFITYGCADTSFFDELVSKTLGAIRCNISNSNTCAQNILYHSMMNLKHNQEKEYAKTELKKRYNMVKDVINDMMGKYKDSGLTVLPFNSGYFMSFLTSVDAETLRLTLLRQYSTGLVSFGSKLIRIAYSVLDLDKIQLFFENVFSCSEKLNKAV